MRIKSETSFKIKRWVYATFVACQLLLCTTGTAHAYTGADVVGGFTTLEALGTFSGTVLAAAVITQCFKWLIPKASPKWVAFGSSAVITLAFQTLVSGDMSAGGVLTAAANAFFAFYGAVGLYETLGKAVTGLVEASRETKEEPEPGPVANAIGFIPDDGYDGKQE